MLLRTLYAVLALIVLSGCSMEQVSNVNKSISDGAESLTQMFGNSKNPQGDNALYQNKNLAKQNKKEEFAIPVDVDTAAARLKRHYEFMSNDEVDAIRKKDASGGWTAGAITDAHQVWSATPGSYYKMGNDWNEYDHLELEVEKNGAGSKLYITYSSPSEKRLASKDLISLMEQIKSVAEGSVK